MEETVRHVYVLRVADRSPQPPPSQYPGGEKAGSLSQQVVRFLLQPVYPAFAAGQPL